MDVTTREDFDAWASARAPSLLRFAFLVTGEQQTAEDAVQSALTTALEKWARVSRVGDIETYVRRMVVNAHISRWRRSGRRESPVAQPRLPNAPDRADAVATRDTLWQACAALPVRQRTALVLRYYEDLDYPEIARILDCAEATARSHVHRGLATLRSDLAREDFHG